MRRLAERDPGRRDPIGADRRRPDRIRRGPLYGRSKALRRHGAALPLEGPARGCSVSVELSFRRFPDTITRRRSGAGSYVNGEWVLGSETEVDLRAAVQPLALEDADFAGGAQLQERLKVYLPASEGELRAAADDAPADVVVYGGKVYVVEESRTWPKFTRAMLLRED